MRPKLTRFTLAALLVLSQLTLAVHQLDFAQHDESQCAVCMVAHGLDYAAPAAARLILVKQPSRATQDVAATPCLFRTPTLRVARSPPPVFLPA